MAREKVITLLPPLGGINNDFARIEQPPKTTVDCRDVFPYGRDFRSRIGQRPGYTSDAGDHVKIVGSAGAARIFCQVSYIASNVPTSQIFAVRNSQGAGAGKGKLYWVDWSSGTGVGTVKETTPGAVPSTVSLAVTDSGAVPTSYAGAVIHRNRLILFGPNHLWAASEVDAYGNWDFAKKTSIRPFTSANIISSSPGSMNDPIIAAIPWTNDLLVFASDHSLWAIRGDLAFGGRVDLLSAGVGILGPSAWTIDPNNNLWLIGTGGIYRGVGNGIFTPINVGKYSNYFQTLNRTTHTPSCVWDRDRYGLWIFANGEDSLFYNARDESFWPTTLGPAATACGIFDGPDPADRQVLFAEGSSPTVYSIDTAADDPGGAIASRIFLGPLLPFGDGQNGILTETMITMGDDPDAGDYSFNYTLQAGNSPYQAYAAPSETATGTITTANRAARIRSKLRGNYFFLKLANSGAGSLFEFESATFKFKSAGRVHA